MRPHALLILAAGLLACSLVTGKEGNTPPPDSTEQVVGPGELSEDEQTRAVESVEIDFPAEPDPVTVRPVLDETRAASTFMVEGVAMTGFARTTSVDGAQFQVNTPEMMVIEGPGDTMDSAAGTTVTITPILSLEGLPFQGGLVAGLDLSPGGLQMVGPASVTITVPASYQEYELVVFAADSSGEEFHLIPALILPPPGCDPQATPEPPPPGFATLPPEIETMLPPTDIACGTTVMVDIMHFSLVGVAQATAAEVASQIKRPPTRSQDQAAQMMAMDLDQASKTAVLWREYENELKARILHADCGTVASVSQRFLAWHMMVQQAKAEAFFRPQIRQATAFLRAALEVCLQNTCRRCLNENSSEVESMVVLYFYYVQISQIAGLPTQVDWLDLTNMCAVKYGFNEPMPPVASGCYQGDCVTATPPSCPTPRSP